MVYTIDVQIKKAPFREFDPNEVIPKGTAIDLGIHSVHHNPDVWDDPWGRLSLKKN
jgi:hypothetical protein